MFGLETNEESFNCANQNVTKNNLNSYITLVNQKSSGPIFNEVLKEAGVIDFCMCNPPFFSSVDDFDPSHRKNRTGKRPAPSNPITGSHDELMIEGGECEFVTKIIEESSIVRHRIRIFTTMLGHKTSVAKMLTVLNSLNITNIAQTEFCQGRTTRWGLAWSFNSDILLRNVPRQGVHPPKKKLFNFDLSDSADFNVDAVLDWLKSTFQVINIQLENIHWESGKMNIVTCKIVAIENTWSKQRRKRREMERTHQQLENVVHSDVDSLYDVNSPERARKKRKIDLNVELLKNPLLVVNINISKHPKTRMITVSLTYLSGTAEHNGVYQILQFLRNSWKPFPL